MTTAPMWLTGDAAADTLLTEDDNALLIGMVLDQQVPMEKAFTGPLVIASRMGGSLDVAAIAAMSEDDFIALCSERPAIHRFPGAMAKTRTSGLPGARRGVRRSGRQRLEGRRDRGPAEGRTGQAALLRSGQGRHLHRGAGRAPGRDPPGWREAAGSYGEQGSFRSVADIVDQDSLQKVRETKRAAKAAKKAAHRPDQAIRSYGSAPVSGAEVASIRAQARASRVTASVSTGIGAVNGSRRWRSPAPTAKNRGRG